MQLTKNPPRTSALGFKLTPNSTVPVIMVCLLLILVVLTVWTEEGIDQQVCWWHWLILLSKNDALQVEFLKHCTGQQHFKFYLSNEKLACTRKSHDNTHINTTVGTKLKRTLPKWRHLQSLQRKEELKKQIKNSIFYFFKNVRKNWAFTKRNLNALRTVAEQVKTKDKINKKQRQRHWKLHWSVLYSLGTCTF